jgi:hypothetical protein
MIKKIDIKGFEAHRIEVNTGGLIFRPTLLVDGIPVVEGLWGNKFNLVKKDGTKVPGRWITQLIGLETPQLEVDNKIYSIVDPNPWYVVLWCALPVLLIFHDLLWGALFGVVGFSINMRLFHSDWPIWKKFLLSSILTIGWISFFVLMEPIILAPLVSK